MIPHHDFGGVWSAWGSWLCACMHTQSSGMISLSACIEMALKLVMHAIPDPDSGGSSEASGLLGAVACTVSAPELCESASLSPRIGCCSPHAAVNAHVMLGIRCLHYTGAAASCMRTPTSSHNCKIMHSAFTTSCKACPSTQSRSYL